MLSNRLQETMWSSFCLLSLWGFKRVNLAERFSRQLHVRSCEICFKDISHLCSSVPIVNFEQVNADWVNIRSWLENCWKMRLEEFIFSKIGRFTCKISVLLLSCTWDNYLQYYNELRRVLHCFTGNISSRLL